MAGEREITVERSLLSRIFNYRTLTVTGACSLVAASLLLKWKKKHSAWVRKYIRGRE